MTEDTNLSNKQSTVTRNSVTQATALEELQSNVLALPQAVKVVLVTCGVEKNHQLQSLWGNEDYQNCGLARRSCNFGSLQFWKYKIINK